MSIHEWDPDAFWSSSDFQRSARLRVQHAIWNYQLGYSLHPKIDTSTTKPLRIADVAAGNGAWLLELAHVLPSENVQLDAFDITLNNFPVAAWLPCNVKTHIWDVFSEVLSEYIGAFDIVHARALCSLIRDNNVEPVLNNLLKLLKPGGILQWDDIAIPSLRCEVPAPDMKVEASETIIKIWNFMSQTQSRLFPDWLYDLSKTLEGKGCEVIAQEEYQPMNELARMWTENTLLAWQDLIPMIPEEAVTIPSGMSLPESMDRKSFAKLFRKAVEECSGGVKLGMVFYVFVAKKST